MTLQKVIILGLFVIFFLVFGFYSLAREQFNVGYL